MDKDQVKIERESGHLFVTLDFPLSKNDDATFTELENILSEQGFTVTAPDTLKETLGGKTGVRTKVSGLIRGQEDARIEAELLDDGTKVRVTCYPQERIGVKLSKDCFQRVLKRHGASDYLLHEDRITSLVESLHPGDAPHTMVIAEKIEHEAEIEIADNKMSATLTMTACHGGERMTLEKLSGMVAEAGVKYGIIDGILEKIVDRGFAEATPIAKGVEAVNGVNAKFNFHFGNDPLTGRPTIREDSSADFYDLNLFESTKANEILVEKTPPTEGTPGRNVLDEEVTPEPGTDFPLPKGKNTVVSEDDPNHLLAAIEGIPRISNKQVVVEPFITIKGDIDFSTGNIVFDGSIIVKGVVNTGFKLKAGGDIVCHGPVEGATIEAGGDVMLKSGINGQNKGLVKAGGSIIARFLENCTAEAENFVVDEAILHCKVLAGDKVEVVRKGMILGGEISAGKEINAKVIGSNAATKTVLEVGIDPHVRSEYSDITRIEAEVLKQLRTLEKDLMFLKRQADANPDSAVQKLKLAQTATLFKRLDEKKDELASRKEVLEGIIAEARYGKVAGADKMYPGVVINISGEFKRITEEIKGAVFGLRDGEIRTIAD